MKIVLSPSKTKKLSGTPTGAHHFNHITESIVAHVQTLNAAALAKILKIKDDKAQVLYELYQQFNSLPVGAAGESYDGIAFKYLDWSTLDDATKAYGESHLVVMSALYGAVEPHMEICEYRLDVVDKIGIPLYEVWHEAMHEYFHKEDWILNLASKEYAKMIAHPVVVTVEFWEQRGDVYKQLSTSSKISRGMMARYCLEHRIDSVSALPRELNGFYLATDVTGIDVPLESMTIRYEKTAEN